MWCAWVLVFELYSYVCLFFSHLYRTRVEKFREQVDQVKERLDTSLAKEQKLLEQIAVQERINANKEVKRQESQRVRAFVEEYDKAANLVCMYVYMCLAI